MPSERMIGELTVMIGEQTVANIKILSCLKIINAVALYSTRLLVLKDMNFPSVLSNMRFAIISK